MVEEMRMAISDWLATHPPALPEEPATPAPLTPVTPDAPPDDSQQETTVKSIVYLNDPNNFALFEAAEKVAVPGSDAGNKWFAGAGVFKMAGLTAVSPEWSQIEQIVGRPVSTDERNRAIEVARGLEQNWSTLYDHAWPAMGLSTSKDSNGLPNVHFKYDELLNADPARIPVDLVSDEKIGPFNQGQVGDCVVLASTYALSQTDAGREILDDSMVFNGPDAQGWDSWTITFKGDPAHPITVNADELMQARHVSPNERIFGTGDPYSLGDVDALLIEVALEKYAQQYGVPVAGNSVLSTIENGSQIDTYWPLLSGQHSQPVTGGQGLRDLAAAHPEGFSATFRAKPADGGHNIEAGWEHAWAIQSVNLAADTVTFVNPWFSDQPITLSISEFEQIVPEIYYLPA